MIKILIPLQGLLIAGWLSVMPQASASVPGQPEPAKAAPVEKLGPNTYRLGSVQVDTAKREVTVTGTVNSAPTLEFFASTLNGLKSYESALSLDSNAINFNAAMLLIGVDPAHSRVAAMQFDTEPPRGDAVDIYVEWPDSGRTRRVRAEELLFDGRAKTTLRESHWVYTGSRFTEDGIGKHYLAELDGVLIGFMHGPQPVIESPINDAIGGYGFFILNPNLGLKEGMRVTVTIRALPLDRKLHK